MRPERPSSADRAEIPQQAVQFKGVWRNSGVLNNTFQTSKRVI